MTTEPESSTWSWRRRLLASARLRILGWYVLLLVITVVGSLLVTRQVLLARLDDEINADLAQEVEELRTLIGGRDPVTGECVSVDLETGDCTSGRNPETGDPFGDDVAAIFDTFLRRNIPGRRETMLTFVGGETYLKPFQPDLPVALESIPEIQAVADTRETVLDEVVTEEVGAIRYLATPVQSEGGTLGVFLVARFVDLARADINELLRLSAGVEAGMLLIASLLAWGVAGRVLGPVRLVTEAARSISDTDLSQRIPVEGATDEVSALAATFNAMLDRLETAFATQRHFIDDAGHELRTPITIIRGHLELLGDDPREREETIAIVTDELDRMSRMVDDLLVLAKAQQPDFLNLQLVDVEELTAELAQKTSALGDRSWQMDAAGTGNVEGDRQRLSQAVIQLAANAVQHTEPGDAIGIGSAIADGHARFWVRDTGPGVPAAERERIFQRFARSAAARRRSEGAGLGLAIVRAIAEAHHGRVELDSREGRGATFTVVVPVDQPAEEEAS